MPATRRGQAYRLGPNRCRLRWYDAAGKRRRKSPFPSKSAALAHYRDAIEPQLRGEPVPVADLTLAEFVPLYLERHAATVRPRTIQTLGERLPHATRVFGDVPLRNLERMTGELASWQAKLPERSRYEVVQALRQTLEAAVRWGHMDRNPAKLAGPNRQPPPRPVRAFTREEVEAIAAELSPRCRRLPAFAAATGLRPGEWQALERRDVDHRERMLNVRRTVSSGEVVELGKTGGSRRQVPLSGRALDALDAPPAQLDSTLLFPAPRGGTLEPRPFSVARVVARDRGVRRPPARPDLRPALDLRLRRARGRRRRPRAGPDHRNLRPHDRAPLRDAARRCGSESANQKGRPARSPERQPRRFCFSRKAEAWATPAVPSIRSAVRDHCLPER